MTIDFSAEEVVEMAEQIERNGATFYRRAAEGTPEPSDRALLLELAAMEDDHERVFASMKEDLLGSRKGLDPFDPHGEAAAYLRTMADGQVFDMDSDPVKFLDDHHGIGNILRIEILFRSRIHPRRLVGSLSEKERHEILRWILTLTRTWMEKMRKRADWISIYRKSGNPCPRCGVLIEFSRQAGRITYACPNCQRL